jgi:hypothetical protein
MMSPSSAITARQRDESFTSFTPDQPGPCVAAAAISRRFSFGGAVAAGQAIPGREPLTLFSSRRSAHCQFLSGLPLVGAPG